VRDAIKRAHISSISICVAAYRTSTWVRSAWSSNGGYHARPLRAIAPSPRGATFVFGMLDELRHAQLQLSFSHDLLKPIPASTGAKGLSHERVGLLAIRNFCDAGCSRQLRRRGACRALTLEHGFTNMQFVALAADAMEVGDIGFSNLLSAFRRTKRGMRNKAPHAGI